MYEKNYFLHTACILFLVTAMFASNVRVWARPRSRRRISTKVLYASRSWTLNSTTTDTIFPVRDHDFFELFLPTPGRLVLEHRVPSSIGSALRVHDESGQLIRWHNRARGAIHRVQVDVSRKGSVFVEVADSRNNECSKEPYQLSNRFTPFPDSHEPNDRRGQGRSIILPVNI